MIYFGKEGGWGFVWFLHANKFRIIIIIIIKM